MRLVRPHIAIITAVEPKVHLEHFKSIGADRRQEPRFSLALEPGGVAVLNRDNNQFARLQRHAKAANAARIVTFGEHKSADAPGFS